MDTTKEQVLFVGEPQICPQVAYVLDIQDYATVKKLAKQNLDQYRNYQIYVCAHKRQSGKYVKLSKKITKQLNIQYLDDICLQIDTEYYANRERHKNDFQNFVAEQAKQTKQQNHTVTTKKQTNTKKSATQNNTNKTVALSAAVNASMSQRILRGMKHPLRAAWHVVLRGKEILRKQKHRHKQRKRQQQIYRQIHKGDLKSLRHLTPSELFLYVLNAKPNPNIQCTRLENRVAIFPNGNIRSCCNGVLPFGNIFYDGELNEIYLSTYARIVKLSSLNQSYCLCDLNHGCKGYCNINKILSTKQWSTPNFPQHIFLAFDDSCNLCCRSCRLEPHTLDKTAQQRLEIITKKLLSIGWLEQVEELQMAGNGEVFYSPYYRRLLITDVHRQQISIISNGILFNEANWQLLANKYSTIYVSISIDAATAETYQKLRGADFQVLMKNLTMLSELHRQGQIRELGLNFVVQRDNLHEMSDFVKLGKFLGVNKINFLRLKNYGSFTEQELLERCLIIDNQYLDYELWCILQDPIFQDQIVNLRGLQYYIDASEKRYRQRYEREQRQLH